MASTDQPIAYRLAQEPAEGATAAALLAPSGVLTCTRALEGMQKEAIVFDEATRASWRLLCDEGPWLNGTDLAPFPLGYFAAGLASCLLADLTTGVDHASGTDAQPALRLDIVFSMEGSILRGTMAAGVDSITLSAISRPGPAENAPREVQQALDEHSAVKRALAAHLPSRFRLCVNGSSVDWPGDPAGALQEAADPAGLFADPPAPADAAAHETVIRKTIASDAAQSGGAVGLQGEQKRSVHITADAKLRADGLQLLGAQCVHPTGSRFEFLASGTPGDERAPDGCTYLSAGVAFCFMTQLGRYAQIKKRSLDGYRIVQRTTFCRDAPSPVETAVFLDSEDSHENNLKMVQMGEQTCYVHTTLREPQEIRISEASE